MSQMNNLLALRTKKGENKQDNPSKMAEMARQSALGHLTSFSGVFSVAELSSKEKETLEELLTLNATEESQDTAGDLVSLISLTGEVKAINNQAALLHGERIKKAQHILKSYHSGAFTGWLMMTYGNRQTPYNFLQYFEFYQALTSPLRQRVEEMPRQAVYTLASRNAPFERKQQVVEDYRGETKTVLLETIRRLFPLEKNDNRRENYAGKVAQALQKAIELLQNPEATYSHKDKKHFQALLGEIRSLI